MKLALEAKFKIPELNKKLIETKNYYIEETNNWHDYYWGVCNGVGQNMLGNMLMEIRKEFFSNMINIVNKHTYQKTNIDSLYIGRGSCLGNPFSHKENTKAEFIVPSRDEAIEKYEQYLTEQLKSNKKIKEEMNFIWKKVVLDMKPIDLICYCKPQSCHGDVIKKFILNKI